MFIVEVMTHEYSSVLTGLVLKVVFLPLFSHILLNYKSISTALHTGKMFNVYLVKNIVPKKNVSYLRNNLDISTKRRPLCSPSSPPLNMLNSLNRAP